MRPIEVLLTTPLGLADARRQTITKLVGSLNAAGYAVTSQSETFVGLGRTSRSIPVWILTVLLFPIGLIFFFQLKREETVSIVLSETAAGTRIEITGSVRKPVANHLASLSTQAAAPPQAPPADDFEVTLRRAGG